MIPTQFEIHVLGNSVFIFCDQFNWAYTPADAVVKTEYKGKYRYFGGLQSEYEENSDEYEDLEKQLLELSETIINSLNRI